jgi:hypothetical protein
MSSGSGSPPTIEPFSNPNANTTDLPGRPAESACVRRVAYASLVWSRASSPGLATDASDQQRLHRPNQVEAAGDHDCRAGAVVAGETAGEAEGPGDARFAVGAFAER